MDQHVALLVNLHPQISFTNGKEHVAVEMRERRRRPVLYQLELQRAASSSGNTSASVVGLHAALKPLLSRSTTGKFDSPPNLSNCALTVR